MVTIGEYTSFCKGVSWRENQNASLQKEVCFVLREKRTKLEKGKKDSTDCNAKHRCTYR